MSHTWAHSRWWCQWERKTVEVKFSFSLRVRRNVWLKIYNFVPDSSAPPLLSNWNSENRWILLKLLEKYNMRSAQPLKAQWVEELFGRSEKNATLVEKSGFERSQKYGKQILPYSFQHIWTKISGEKCQYYRRGKKYFPVWMDVNVWPVVAVTACVSDAYCGTYEYSRC